ncbi:hypothetical protein BH20ACT6_BH20ACT6_17770 [soil metagenome]
MRGIERQDARSARQKFSTCCGQPGLWGRFPGLLETSCRAGVWPDSVQVPGGSLSFGLPTRSRVWLTFGLLPVGHRDEAWLKKGLPCS